MVVIGAHISIGFAYSTPKALSIFFKDIQEDLEASYSEIAWISSIMLAAMYAGGELIQSMFVTLVSLMLAAAPVCFFLLIHFSQLSIPTLTICTH